MLKSTGEEEVGGIRPLTSAVSEIMKMTADVDSVETGYLMLGMVDEEVELVLANKLHNLGCKKWDFDNKTPHLGSRTLHLEFSKKVHSPALTGTLIKGEGSTSLQVVLVDTLTKEIVSSGPESSLEVEIVLLPHDFSVSNWTTEDFNDKIVRGNGGRRVLTGDVHLSLKDGVALLHNVSFTHTKIWRAKCEFRLGARVLNPTETRIKEAKTDPFRVEDRRGQLYGKHYPPLLSDHVWRLKCIMKDGAYHQRLVKEGITTVKDLWTLLNTNQKRLHNILSGMSTKYWEELVDHLRTCKLDTKLNLYWGSNQHGVVFNVVGQILGIFVKDKYTVIQDLSQIQQDLATDLVASALTHTEKVTTFDDEASLFSSLSRIPVVDQPLESPKVSQSNQVQPSSLSISVVDDEPLESPAVSQSNHLLPSSFDECSQNSFSSISIVNQSNQVQPFIFDECHFPGTENDFSRVSIVDDEALEWNQSNHLQPFHFPGTENSDQTLNHPSPIYDYIVNPNDYHPSPPVSSTNDDFSFWDSHNTSYDMYNRHLDFPSPKTYSIICEANDIMQAYNNHHDFQDNNYADVVMTSGSQKKCFTKRRAQIRWRKLSNVLKFVSVAKKPKAETITFHAMVALNDIVVKSRSGVSGLRGLQRKQYCSKRDIAKSRWRVLWSVMRLCSNRFGQRILDQPRGDVKEGS